MLNVLPLTSKRLVSPRHRSFERSAMKSHVAESYLESMEFAENLNPNRMKHPRLYHGSPMGAKKDPLNYMLQPDLGLNPC